MFRTETSLALPVDFATCSGQLFSTERIRSPPHRRPSIIFHDCLFVPSICLDWDHTTRSKHDFGPVRLITSLRTLTGKRDYLYERPTLCDVMYSPSEVYNSTEQSPVVRRQMDPIRNPWTRTTELQIVKTGYMCPRCSKRPKPRL